MRPSAVLTMAWLPLVMLYTDQGASALLPDSPVQIRLSQASKTCSPPVTTTRSVRFYSVKTAGGSLYVRHLISQAVLEYFQAAGGAVNETSRDFATCANTAEKKKKNMFQFANGACTSYAAMPPSALLPSCSGVGNAVVYVVKTALNSATLPAHPVPKVTTITLTANPTSVTASWTLQDVSNLTQSYMVTIQSFGSLLVVSTAGVNIMNNVSTVIIPAGVMTYQMDGVSPCSNTSVTVTPQYSNGTDNGTSMTVSTTAMTPDTTTTPSFDGVVFSGGTLDNITRTWNFRGCRAIATYSLVYGGEVSITMTLATSVTSIVVLGNEVCGDFSVGTVNAFDSTNTTLATSDFIPSFETSGDMYPYYKQSACYVKHFTTMNFSDAVAYCSTVYRGKLFSYGTAYFRNLTSETFSTTNSWMDLQYNSTTSQWVWGNGEVEPTSSSLWKTAPPNSAVGHCVATDGSDQTKIAPTDCTQLKTMLCFKFY